MLLPDTLSRLDVLEEGTEIELIAVACRHWIFGFTEVDLDRRRLQLLKIPASNEGTDIQKYRYILRTRISQSSLAVIKASSVTYKLADRETM
jgi:hypothetical protein